MMSPFSLMQTSARWKIRVNGEGQGAKIFRSGNLLPGLCWKGERFSRVKSKGVQDQQGIDGKERSKAGDYI